MQLCVTLVAAAAGYAVSGADIAISILFGGLICCIGNGLFIWLYFYRKPGQRSAHTILRTAYWAELSKLILTVVLLVTVMIAFDGLDFLTFFAAFFVSQLFYWFAPLLFK